MRSIRLRGHHLIFLDLFLANALALLVLLSVSGWTLAVPAVLTGLTIGLNLAVLAALSGVLARPILAYAWELRAGGATMWHDAIRRLAGVRWPDARPLMRAGALVAAAGLVWHLFLERHAPGIHDVGMAVFVTVCAMFLPFLALGSLLPERHLD